LRSQTALTGYFFGIYGHWFFCTWFMLNDGTKR
jgi:hypothetical protein